MIFFSIAQATHHLGIDAKTLHRWLTDAHLCLQSLTGSICLLD